MRKTGNKKMLQHEFQGSSIPDDDKPLFDNRNNIVREEEKNEDCVGDITVKKERNDDIINKDKDNRNKASRRKKQNRRKDSDLMESNREYIDPYLHMFPVTRTRSYPAPVSCFKHAPFVDCFSKFAVGMKVEVRYKDCDNDGAHLDLCWVATIVETAGYRALLRYDGYERNSSKDFWLNFAIDEVYPVGWSATQGQPLIPPSDVYRFHDWKVFLVKNLTGADTLPSDFHAKLSENVPSQFRCGMKLEIVDRSRLSKVSVAVVQRIVCRRLQLILYSSTSDEEALWCHEESPLIHPVGWAQKVGYHVSAPFSYMRRMKANISSDEDAFDSCFVQPRILNVSANGQSVMEFEKGMKLEAIDLANRSCVSPATVMKIIEDGYLMVRLDCNKSTPLNSSWYCYNFLSPYLLPVGYSRKNSIKMTPPLDYPYKKFVWGRYLKDTGSIPAPECLFSKVVPKHEFQVGMQLEVDIGDDNTVCIASISRIVGRLLKIHCDGWPERSDQWIDCESTDLYPIGWHQLIMHNLGSLAEQGGGRKQKKKRKKKNRRHQVEGKTLPSRANQRTPNCTIVSSDLLNGSVTGSEDSLKYAILTSAMSGMSVSSPPGSPRKTGNETNGLSLSSVPSVSRSTSVALDLTCSSIQDLPSTSFRDVAGPSFRDTAGSSCQNGAGPSFLDMAGPSSQDLSYFQEQPSSSSHSQLRKSQLWVEASTSHVQSTTIGFKLIPKKDDSDSSESGDIFPEEWNIFDVSHFLKLNNCGEYSDIFCCENVDGVKLLNLTKNDIVKLTGSRMGPSVKIYELIQFLRRRVKKN